MDFNLLDNGYDFHTTDPTVLDRGEQNRHYTYVLRRLNSHFCEINECMGHTHARTHAQHAFIHPRSFGREKNVSVIRSEFFYPCCADEPWPTITYTVHVARRATSFFFRFLVFPQVAHVDCRVGWAASGRVCLLPWL